MENRRFWPPETLPKPLQNPSQINVLSNMYVCIDFALVLDWRGMLHFLKISVSPRREHYFSGFY